MIPGRVDVAVSGGGPAGLAVAIEAASRGLATAVLEHRPGTPDKACGEGVLPWGVGRLHRLGVLERLGPEDARAFAGIRWIQEDGTAVEGHFPGGGRGLGVRRTALVAALAERAREAGARLLAGVEVVGFAPTSDGVLVRTAAGPVRARLLVAADGLASPLRRAAGLDRPLPNLPRRFGVRRHYRIAPWTDLVEVHWSDGAEAYVTPAGAERVGVALLFAPDRTGPASFDRLLRRFPALERRLAGAAALGRDLGAGPLAREARGVLAPGLVLAGDAAGYLDALTGEGISLALEDAAALGRLLPEALAADPGILRRYARAVAASRRRYVGSTAPVLLLARRPPLRRRAVAFLARHPAAFSGLLGAVAGAGGAPAPALLRFAGGGTAAPGPPTPGRHSAGGG